MFTCTWFFSVFHLWRVFFFLRRKIVSVDALRQFLRTHPSAAGVREQAEADPAVLAQARRASALCRLPTVAAVTAAGSLGAAHSAVRRLSLFLSNNF